MWFHASSYRIEIGFLNRGFMSADRQEVMSEVSSFNTYTLSGCWTVCISVEFLEKHSYYSSEQLFVRSYICALIVTRS